jgi:hypothetical protein
MDLEKTSVQEWIARRASAVRKAYTAYDALVENGIDSVPDQTTPTQISCPFHGKDNRPSARYYPASGSHSDYVRCYTCKENWDSINLLAKFRGLRFMQALSDLERRYGIKIQRHPEENLIDAPSERKSSYQSTEWNDIPRVLKLLESKLVRLRDKVAMLDFIKWCRVLDAVQWDLEHDGPNESMSKVLQKLRNLMDDNSDGALHE